MNKTHSHRFYTQGRQKELQRVRFAHQKKKKKSINSVIGS